ncbi:Fe-S-cluster oxidoreductase [Stutzerimonas degradans]|nr:Fe-S-cluster oxidoreductase [Stutzerimonas degradans]EKM97634.1 Fe-S-cluster oxidoreductase [Stutzerimonas degradans]
MKPVTSGRDALDSRAAGEIPHRQLEDAPVSCSSCAACCCRLEVLLFGERDVPARFIDIDAWGAQVMRRLDDGWCAALDRDSMRCTIYAVRPLICREFELGSADCLEERQGSASAYR